jgi:D-arabinose 1-dehydrogenase-like Zn-dependent alcohol dehydrogenase
MGAVFGGLRPEGRFLVVGADMEPIPVPAAAFIGGSKSLVGHASGTSIDSEDTLDFSVLSGVRPMIETMPLERASEAYERMMSGEARFRRVITTGAEQQRDLSVSGARASAGPEREPRPSISGWH